MVGAEQQLIGALGEVLETEALLGDRAADAAAVLEAFTHRPQQEAALHGDRHLPLDLHRKQGGIETAAIEAAQERCQIHGPIPPRSTYPPGPPGHPWRKSFDSIKV